MGLFATTLGGWGYPRGDLALLAYAEVVKMLVLLECDLLVEIVLTSNSNGRVLKKSCMAGSLWSDREEGLVDG